MVQCREAKDIKNFNALACIFTLCSRLCMTAILHELWIKSMVSCSCYFLMIGSVKNFCIEMFLLRKCKLFKKLSDYFAEF